MILPPNISLHQTIRGSGRSF